MSTGLTIEAREVDNIFQKFSQTKKWDNLPKLQQGLMLKTLEKAMVCNHTARELYKLLDKIMHEKRKLVLKLRR